MRLFPSAPVLATIVALTTIACDESDEGEDPNKVTVVGDSGGVSSVGSRDCDLIGTHYCDECQGVACVTGECEDYKCREETECGLFPCIDNVRVVQGCAQDADCAEFPDTRCGRYTAPQYVCSYAADNE